MEQAEHQPIPSANMAIVGAGPIGLELAAGPFSRAGTTSHWGRSRITEE